MSKYLIMLLFLFSVLSCTFQVKKKEIQPESEIISRTCILNNVDALFNIVSAQLPSLKKKMSGIKIIKIRCCALKSDSKDITLWKRELERYFLTKGISLINEQPAADIPLLEKNKIINVDAVLIIDELKIDKIKDTYKTKLRNHKEQNYNYQYYVASISGKILYKDTILLWSTSVTASSFNILTSPAPSIKIIAKRDYRFSPKKNAWVRDTWNYYLDDNFQSYFKDSFHEKQHKKKLINFTVKEFLKSLF